MKKTVLITGAAGNMGSAMVEKFLFEGYKVAAIVNPGHKTSLPDNNPDLHLVATDLSDEKAAEEMIGSVLKETSAIDVAVLTVGGFAMGGLETTPIKAISDQWQLNFVTTYNVARPIFLQMIKQGYGRIFLPGSRPGLNMKNSNGMVAYGLSKSLVFRLAELMNAEAEGKNVITQVMVPSTIDTPQNRRSMPNADFSKWVKPETIAETVFESVSKPADTKILVF